MAAMDNSAVKLAVAAMVLLGFTIAVGRSVNTTVVAGPKCDGEVATDGKTAGYIGAALAELAGATSVEGRGKNKTCNVPDTKPGSISGTAECKDGANFFDCLACLGKAEAKLVDGCRNRTEASVQLQDCQIHYAKIK